MKFEDVSAEDLKQFNEIMTKLFDIARYLKSCNLNECEAAREAYEKLADVQIFLMESYFTLGLKNLAEDLQKEIKVNNQYYFSINLASRYGDKNQLLKSDSDIKALKIKTLKRNYN